METARSRVSPSLVAALVLWAAITVRLITHAPVNILSWDTFGYHLYLPATFIHHDPGISDEAWVRSAMDTYKGSGTLYQISELPNGRWVDKYPMGLAMLWSPFFIAGHLAAGLFGAPQDGFSKPYQWSLIIAAIVYMLAGLLLVRKVVGAFFGERITAIVLVVIVLGTNYLHQALQGTGMPHLFLFTLGAGVLWHSVKWQREGERRDAMILGLLLGLLVVSRPSEVVWALIPLLIGLVDVRSWKQHVRSLWVRRPQLAWMAAITFMVCLPQLAYWKWMTGKWLYMSYNNPGEGFEFLHPYTWDVLFSFRKGWYIYTPIMLLATLGILALRRSAAELRWPVIAFFVLNLFIVSSWSCWWYADSFGQRALVQSYALMALPLGALLQWLGERRFLLRTIGALGVLALLGLNLFQIRQCEAGLIHTSRMTWPAYKAVFARMDAPADLALLLSVERSYSGENGAPDPSRYQKTSMAHVSFEEALVNGEGGSRTGFVLDKERPFTPAWSSEWAAITAYDHAWFEVTCRAQRPPDGSAPALSLVTTFDHNGQSYAYTAHDINWGAAAPGDWIMMRAWYLSPEVRRPADEMKVYCWLRDTLPVEVADLHIDLHEPVR